MHAPRLKVSVGAVILLFIYILGGYSDRHDIFPFSAFKMARSFFTENRPSRFAFDRAGRLVSDDQKSVVPCPQQTARTAVLLLIGQSNAGNHAGQRFRSEHGGNIVNYFNGKCYIAISPLLGSDGTNGEYWTQLGNFLVDRGTFDQVVLVPAAISGSEIARWSQGGDLNTSMIDAVSQFQQQSYHVTHVLWHQGEIDYVIGTSERTYHERFMSMVGSLRSHGIEAPIYVSVTSKCLGESNGGTRFHSLTNSIASAQLALPDQQKGIRMGVNTDALLDEVDRYDDCHFSGSGAQKVAKAWADLLQ